jgi:hypothetical protein
MFSKRVVSSLVLVISIFSACSARSQEAKSTACNFDDGNQVAVKYLPVPVSHDKLPNGKIWTPGKSPMFLMSSVALRLGNTTIPAGSHSMYVIPGKDSWTLVLNKNLDPNAQYQQQQDIVRVPMGIGTLPEPAKTLGVYFGHVAPTQCNMRIYYGKTGSWIEFHEQGGASSGGD